MTLTPQNAVEDAASDNLRASVAALFDDLKRLDRGVACLAAVAVIRSGAEFLATNESPEKARVFLHDAAEAAARIS